MKAGPNCYAVPTIACDAKATGWAVVAPDGFVSLMKDHARAEFWAVQCHGMIKSLHAPVEPEPRTPNADAPA